MAGANLTLIDSFKNRETHLQSMLGINMKEKL